MADVAYQSLYRRYRSQRFDEVRGQEHVTKGLRNAVREGRVGHAYLFSGPRGTGKTSTARILAKVLNCAAPEDGEPCGRCDNCQAVERGQVVDWLLEQDAASKSKVDDMRDLLDRVPLGTSGNRKVIILDEVHMLSQGAENALLKTLEEPPAHVVFVLATTDPQKVRPTIRSRTQHNEFRLLPPDVMAEHVRYVIQDSGLDLDESVVAHVVRAGAGSARDALSALDQVAALGEVVAHDEPVDSIIDALIAKDAGAVLVAMAEATASGRDVRGLGEALIARLRDAFLAVMGVGDDHLPAADRARASEVGEALGAAGLTRALEVLGEALMELTRKPDPRVVVEVALVRLVRPEADRDIDAILQRLERLERGGLVAPQQSEQQELEPTQQTEAPQQPAPQSSQRGPASQARAVLAEKKTTKPPKAKPKSDTRGAQASPAAKDPPKASSQKASTDLAELTKVWSNQVIGELPIPVRSKWRGGKWIESGEPGVAHFSVPNEWHKKACEQGQVDVEKALAEHIGGGIRVEVVVDGAAQAAPTPQSEPDDPGEDEEVVDVASLPDADEVTGGVDLLLQEFDGELVEGNDNE